jgi:hexosaminidase
LAVAGVATATAMTEPASAAPAAPAIVPKPVTETTGQGTFTLSPKTQIVVRDQTSRAIARQFADQIKAATGYPLPVSHRSPHNGDIRLVLGDPGTLAGDKLHEGYQLNVTKDAVTLTAPKPAGLFNGIQTIRQLLPGKIESSHRQSGPWTIPAVSVTDYPRYEYRGFMIDIARHYRTPDDVKKLIDIASTYKLNTLHLHVSDDQGFRIVINGFPRLTSIGGQGSVGTQGRTMDPGGFWTQDDYRGVVAYAAAHFMSVVPEVDSPSHNNAIVMSEYDDVNNPLLNGHPQDINCGTPNPPQWNYTGDVGYSGMCPESENTWAIYRAIIGQLSAMSTSPYYNLGGDEAHQFTAQKYADFVNKESPIVQSFGKIPMGWADGYATTPGTTPPAGSVAESWLTGATDAAAAVAKNMKVVMAPADHTYLDQTFPNDTSGLGLSWACRHCDLDKAYNWEPGGYTGVPDSSVLGVEGAMWSETTRTLSDVEYMILPRLLAVAEVAWSPKADRSGPTSAAYADFVQRVAANQSLFDAEGWNYYRSAQVPWPNP